MKQGRLGLLRKFCIDVVNLWNNLRYEKSRKKKVYNKDRMLSVEVSEYL